MELILERKYKKANYTIGNLYLSSLPTGEGWGEAFCNTLECPVGTLEEMRTAGSRKAIPPGTYNIRMAWSPKFKRTLPLIEVLSPSGEVERGHILIHAGNTVQDTAGCILVGKNTKVGKVLESRKTLSQLIAKIRTAISNGEEVKITIKAPL